MGTISRQAPAQVSRNPDPVTNDPARVDTSYPPRSAELAIESHGSRMNGLLYVATGKGPHPTILLLHGFPGNERNQDLGQAFRRAGMNALVFSYRGTWGSGGTFSFSHALEDVAAAVAYVRSDSSVAAYAVDPRRVILVGHSMGGWLALMGGAAAGPSVACTVALDFWNVGRDGRNLRAAADTSLAAYFRWVTGPGGPLRVDHGPDGLLDEIEQHADSWDLERNAGAITGRPALILSTTNNRAHLPLVAALDGARAGRVTALQWRTDHSFSDRRIQLARTIVDWLHRRCGS
jgi:pimeloyl-ACP methyl ester carboxylesterase